MTTLSGSQAFAAELHSNSADSCVGADATTKASLAEAGILNNSSATGQAHLDIIAPDVVKVGLGAVVLSRREFPLKTALLNWATSKSITAFTLTGRHQVMSYGDLLETKTWDQWSSSRILVVPGAVADSGYRASTVTGDPTPDWGTGFGEIRLPSPVSFELQGNNPAQTTLKLTCNSQVQLDLEVQVV